MAEFKGPWDLPPPEPQTAAPMPANPDQVRRRPHSLAILVGVLALVALAVWGLTRLFPDRFSLSDDGGQALGAGGMLALVAASLLARRISLKDAARNTLIWGALAAVLIVGYTYRDELGQGLARVRSALIPAYAVSTAPHEMVLNQDADGQYYAIGRVNGQSVTFLIDTGASDIVLSPDDAKRLGVDLAALHFDDPYETANGDGRGARYAAASLALGPMQFSDVAMSINQEPMRTSLLGMAFFKRLQSYSFEDRRLRLKWR